MVYFLFGGNSMLVTIVFASVMSFLIGMIVGILMRMRGDSIEQTDWYDDYGWALPKHIQELCEEYGWKEVVEEYYKGNWG